MLTPLSGRRPCPASLLVFIKLFSFDTVKQSLRRTIERIALTLPIILGALLSLGVGLSPGSLCLSLGISLLSFLCLSREHRGIPALDMFTNQDTWRAVLVLLSGLILYFIISGTAELSLTKGKWFFNLSLFSLFIILWGVFSLNNIITFFILFETRAITIFVIIIGWGYQPERMMAGTLLLIYTSLASLPLLLSFLLIGSFLGLEDFWSLIIYLHGTGTSNSVGSGNLLGAAVMAAFFVKFPVYFFHLWLPKAHVEASAGGSMLLAGVLLKIGGYGLYRVMPLAPRISSIRGVSWALWGSAGIRLICLRQKDFKVMIAYSSVAHIGAVIACILTKTTFAATGRILIIVAHGVSSSILFFMAGLIYNTTQRRQIALNKRGLTVAPLFTAFWAVGCFTNMGVPPAINFWAEILRLISLMGLRMQAAVPFGVVLFARVAYSATLYGVTQAGQRRRLQGALILLKIKDLATLMAHSILLFILSPLFIRLL